MTTAKQIEPNVNNALGNLLKTMMPTCKVLSENTQTFPDHPGRHADVLVIATGRNGQRGNSPQSKPYGLPDQLSAT